MVRGGENIPPVGPATLLTRKRRGTRHFLMGPIWGAARPHRILLARGQ